jgi:hypothetical protein
MTCHTNLDHGADYSLKNRTANNNLLYYSLILEIFVNQIIEMLGKIYRPQIPSSSQKIYSMND